MKSPILLFFISVSLLQSCSNNNNQTINSTIKDSVSSIKVPLFDAEAAYNTVKKQTEFGPRTPGSTAQKLCAAWIQEALKECSDTVFVQNVKVKAGDGKMLPCINIIGSINPSATKRILLLTHWDSRPWADQDINDKNTPIIAADDAGSGVAVLIQVLKAIKTSSLNKDWGIDVLCEDVEDYGKTEWGEDSYCLGTQYWAHHPHVKDYKAQFGILLDMVGAANARFPLEVGSSQLAGDVQQKVWKAASTAGYSSFFPFENNQGGITDDHIYINQITHIPTIDIINIPAITSTGFAPHWHTHNDNLSIIDKNTLKAVGQTLLQVIYETSLTTTTP